MGEAPAKHVTRRAARAASYTAGLEWEKQVHEVVSTFADVWSAEVKRQSGGFEPLVAKLLDLHKPFVTDSELHSPASLRCSECFNTDDAYYERGSAPWPCKTVLLAAEGLNLPTFPELPPEPTFEDFWDEPTVTVRFAHHTIDNAFTSGQDVTMKLSDAVRYKGALDTLSREQVMDLNQ